MNILHLKYAVEVAKTQSISKAAENLYMGQPNLSRAIKDLEESLGITIFKRTSRGITITPEGEEFLRHASKIVAQVDEVEELYKNGKSCRHTFSVSVPRDECFSAAMSELAKQVKLGSGEEMSYEETNSLRTINNVAKGEVNIGIVRYQQSYEKYFLGAFSEKKLVVQEMMPFERCILTNRNSAVSREKILRNEQLGELTEVAYGDPYIPSLSSMETKKAEMSEYTEKRIYVYDRLSALNLLSSLEDTFMWSSNVPEEVQKQFGLAVKRPQNTRIYKDAVICRRDYAMTDADKLFIRCVSEQRARCDKFNISDM